MIIYIITFGIYFVGYRHILFYNSLHQPNIMQKTTLRLWSLSCFIALFTYCVACAQPNGTTNEKASNYIQQHAKMALEEMHRLGVPSSITLAQGMLESSFGESRLATQGQNHFGIKCKSNWTGETIYEDDDAPQECFRKYKSVKESYKDHSNFLRNHPKGNYTSLFSLPQTDYVGWANGLKAAGYATNPQYAELLINLIERYRLDYFDYVQPHHIDQQITAYFSKYWNKEAENTASSDNRIRINLPAQPPKATTPIPDAININLPGKVKQVHINGRKAILANMSLPAYDVADQFDISVAKLRQYNDMQSSDAPFAANIPIFLQSKRNKSSEKYAIHTTRSTEDMYDISQQYGVKLSKLYKRNRMKPGQEPKAGEEIYLRKKAPKRPLLRA